MSEAALFDKVVFQLPNGNDHEQILWPDHCVQNTDGANFHPDLKVCDIFG